MDQVRCDDRGGTALKHVHVKARTALAALIVAAASGLGTTPADATEPPPILNGTPFVGAEWRMMESYRYWGCEPDESSPNGYRLEWLADGVPIPPGRQGETLLLTVAERGKRISLKAYPTTPEEPGCPDGPAQSPESAPVAASNRAMGWTGRGNFELLGRSHDGTLMLYPRTYEYRPGSCEGPCPQFFGSWDEPREVGWGWNVFDVVFSPGDFDGDGFNDILGRDATGDLYLYPGDGGWLPRQVVGTGWNFFNAIVGPGDFTGDGAVDMFAVDHGGTLHQYRTDGLGAWAESSVDGTGWQTLANPGGAGSFTHSGINGIYAVNPEGDLVHYSDQHYGGVYGPSVIGTGWDIFNVII